jgi:hypothetical protein
MLRGMWSGGYLQKVGLQNRTAEKPMCLASRVSADIALGFYYSEEFHANCLIYAFNRPISACCDLTASISRAANLVLDSCRRLLW